MKKLLMTLLFLLIDIFVPNKGMLYVYHLHHFDKAAVIDLNDELKKGKHSYDLSSLINKK